MAIFKRTKLKEMGLTEEQIEFIMTESGRVVSSYLSKEEAEAMVAKAIEEHKPDPIDPTTTDEYKALSAKLEMMQTIGSDDFNNVKSKFKETVYNLLDHSEGHKPYSEQMEAVKADFEEYFGSSEPTDPPKPNFGGEPKGSAPSGNASPSFGDYWGYTKKE